jgi:hypothetical protein
VPVSIFSGLDHLGSGPVSVIFQLTNLTPKHYRPRTRIINTSTHWQPNCVVVSFPTSSIALMSPLPLCRLLPPQPLGWTILSPTPSTTLVCILLLILHHPTFSNISRCASSLLRVHPASLLALMSVPPPPVAPSTTQTPRLDHFIAYTLHHTRLHPSVTFAPPSTFSNVSRRTSPLLRVHLPLCLP